VFALDVEGRYTDLNPACERLSGFTPGDLLGRVYGDRSSAPEEARRALETALQGRPLTFQHSLIGRDNRLIPVQVTLVPIIVNGSTVGVYGIAKNIAERLLAERRRALHARRQSAVADLGLLALTDIPLHELLATSVELVSAVLEVEVAGLLESVPDCDAMQPRVGMGFPPAGKFRADSRSFLGRVLDRGECVCVDDDDPVMGALPDEALFADLGTVGGLAIRVPGREHHNGVLLACSRRSRAFSDDEKTFIQQVANVLGAAIDRQATADDLRRREQEFKVLVENSPDNIVRVDRELRVTYANPATTRLLGVPASAVIGQTRRDAGAPDARIFPWERAVRRVFRTGEEDELEMVYPLPAGGERYFHVRLSPEFGEDGAVNSVLGVGRDVTVNKQREEERTQIYQALLERDSRLHELVERVLLNQQQTQSGKVRSQSASTVDQFTKRERQILRLLARGLTNRQIAQQITLSPSTVKNYIAGLLLRLNAADRTQAAVLAAGLGLLDDELGPSEPML
jgi:PAS domain S-box-containing protein